MLATVLNSEQAIQMSIAIVRVFATAFHRTAKSGADRSRRGYSADVDSGRDGEADRLPGPVFKALGVGAI